MHTDIECNLCFTKRAIILVRRFTDNRAEQQAIMRELFNLYTKMDYNLPPAQNAMKFYKLLRNKLGQTDLFIKEKDEHNALIMNIEPFLKEKVEQSPNSFNTALRYALAGNIIDLGVFVEVDVENELEKLMALTPVVDDSEFLKNAADKAKKILYLGDNCGEIVMDKLLIEQLGPEKVTFVVRGGPVINDATMREAEIVGMTKLCKVITNGVAAPGTLLSDVSDEFLQHYKEADLIISKGQGNFETLCDEVDNERIVFVFLVKCSVVAGDTALKIGSPVVMSMNTLLQRRKSQKS